MSPQLVEEAPELLVDIPFATNVVVVAIKSADRRVIPSILLLLSAQ